MSSRNDGRRIRKPDRIVHDSAQGSSFELLPGFITPAYGWDLSCEAARRFAKLAASLAGVRRVVLFGSVARGTIRPGRDVDVAVVLDRRTEETMDRIYDAAAKIQDETGLKVVPVGVVLRELETDTRFARDLREGEILYERP